MEGAEAEMRAQSPRPHASFACRHFA